MNEKILTNLIKKYGEPYSRELGINVGKGDAELFKWFIASMLFGARIPEKIAVNTFKEFERMGVLTPEKVLATGWNGVVGLLDNGGYVRYDFSTATDLLEATKLLKKKYGGSFSKLHSLSPDATDLRKRLMEMRGVGPVTASIFLRDLREIWSKAEPLPTPLVTRSARELGIREIEKVLKQLPPEKSIALETALVRVGKMLKRKALTNQLVKC
ncbi:hypothetical protein HY991_04600 [Candidatus Micrarchaeota archaeon]|nr:hypothetical protein [Candidatus Micrarchaeota archaeon]